MFSFGIFFICAFHICAGVGDVPVVIWSNKYEIRYLGKRNYYILLLVSLSQPLKGPNPVIYHLFLNLCTGSELTNELIRSYSLLHTRFSQPLNPPIPA